MANILERRMVQKSFKIQLEILKEYFSANDLKLLILSRNNNLKIYSEVFNNLLTPEKNIEISTDLFNKIYNSENNKKIKKFGSCLTEKLSLICTLRAIYTTVVFHCSD